MRDVGTGGKQEPRPRQEYASSNKRFLSGQRACSADAHVTGTGELRLRCTTRTCFGRRAARWGVLCCPSERLCGVRWQMANAIDAHVPCWQEDTTVVWYGRASQIKRRCAIRMHPKRYSVSHVLVHFQWQISCLQLVAANSTQLPLVDDESSVQQPARPFTTRP